MTPQHAETLVRTAASHLQAGDAAAARTLIDQVTATGMANIQVWMMAAVASRMTGDQSAAEHAADQVLAMEPRAVRALILKGDCRADAGDRRAASAFYGRALALAGEQNLPEDLRRDMTRIEQAQSQLAQGYARDLNDALARAGLPDGAMTPRFRQSIGLLTGERQLYPQRPSLYYFPELPVIQFFDRTAFDWVAGLEAQTDAIRDELMAAMRDDAPFRPYLVNDPGRPRTDFHGLHDNPAWSSLYLFEKGAPVAEQVRRCPRTWAAMQAVPLAAITTRAPTVMFSRLKAGARIPPHHGAINARLICHLPLIVPPGCGFRVGNEVREWREGEVLIFDDTIEHEAWNDSDRDRVVLIFDVWRPELSAGERAAVSAVFEAVDGQ